MIKGLSFIIACILTALLVMILYPIAATFWAIGVIGDVVGTISKWIFAHANRTIQYLWAELREDHNIAGHNFEDQNFEDENSQG